MIGFVNFKYRYGIILMHTKSTFNSIKALTVQNSKLKRMLVHISAPYYYIKVLF